MADKKENRIKNIPRAQETSISAMFVGTEKPLMKAERKTQKKLIYMTPTTFEKAKVLSNQSESIHYRCTLHL